jgi:hypothetical protein
MKFVLTPLEQAQVNPYLNPPADTPYGLEYAFHLLGDVQPFRVEGTSYFRLPFVPLVAHVLPSKSDAAWRVSNVILQHWTAAERYARVIASKIPKPTD